MSLECSDCERDLRGPHADGCPRIADAMSAFYEFHRDHSDDAWEDVTVQDAFVGGFRAAKRKDKTAFLRLARHFRVHGQPAACRCQDSETCHANQVRALRAMLGLRRGQTL